MAPLFDQEPKYREIASIGWVGGDSLEMKHPKRIFQDSWRPEDKALESAEEEVLEHEYPEEIARERAERHAHTPPLRGFEPEPAPPDSDS